MPANVSEATARSAARQVWFLAGLGLVGGLITLAAFGWILRQTATQREEIDALQSELTVLVAAADSNLARLRAELTGYLTGDEREDGEKDWLLHLQMVIENSRSEARHPEIEDHLAQLDEELLGLGVLRDETRQPGSYQYRIEGIKHEQIWEQEVQRIYDEAMQNGELQKGDFSYPNMLPFKYYLDHGGHNCTHVYNSDTSTAEGQTAANLEGRARMLRMYRFLKSSIPGCEQVELKTMYPRAVARETYRTEGEYIITEEDFLHATDFDDKICNAFNYIDMHSQETGCDVTFHESEDLLPKIPFRALIPKGSSRITVAGRIVSAHRIALAGIRAQCVCMAMGQAMGAAAALAVQRKTPSREVSSSDILALTIEHGAVKL